MHNRKLNGNVLIRVFKIEEFKTYKSIQVLRSDNIFNFPLQSREICWISFSLTLPRYSTAMATLLRVAPEVIFKSGFMFEKKSVLSTASLKAQLFAMELQICNAISWNTLLVLSCEH